MLAKLIRYLSAPGLVTLVLVASLLVWVYQHLASDALLDHEARTNAALTRSFANTVWPQYRDFVREVATLSPNALRQRAELKALEQAVREQMAGLSVVKVKLYDLRGLTVFSTEAGQIGDDKSAAPGFVRARNGEVVSEITFRNQVDGLEGVMVDRNLVSSYVPIRDPRTDAVEAVLEVYSDVTELVGQLRRTRWQTAGAVLLGLLLLSAVFILRASVFIRARDRERRVAEDEMRKQAYHDSLTGLPNRLSFSERLDRALSMEGRNRQQITVMFLDVDRFKLVNDSLGHYAGDVLLKDVAGRIQRAVRDSDLVFRMGGDEFTIILTELKRHDEAERVAERVLRAFDESFQLLGREIILSTSIGIAAAIPEDRTHEAPLKRADVAMYQAKAAGRNRYAFYTVDLEHVASQRLEMQVRLQKAFNESEFALYYQPRIESKSGKVVGVEALLRWHDPLTGKIVSPGEFIPVLEDTGLIIPVGRWVLREACRQASRWAESSVGPLSVSVNIAAAQFADERLVADVRQALRETGLAPSHLELEITENVLIEDTERVVDTLQAIKGIGVSVSIDDFGTGYSSLSYLHRFPIDYIKIDQSFVRGLPDSETSASITRSIAALAANLKLQCVAEGVETQAQAEFLRGIGCAQMQGYFISPPVPADEAERLIWRRNVRRSVTA